MDVDITEDVLGEETEADLAEWLVADGDQVSAGQAIAQVETSKVMVDIEAPAAGTIEIVVEAGSVFDVGATIARIA
ncbi:lipoyl domain-containing protein [Herbiconiux sp. YIM B11900]|uniref:lipoyl domain-containing protein n=1 Tax=Herbiconiux sp. YIM B11900 TaxID=3404131 RepID=UPI003F845300